MRLQLRIPRFASSTVEAGSAQSHPVLDGSDVTIVNHWNLAPHTVALIGRPAVWFSFDVQSPRIHLGPLTIASKRFVWEQDFGGHLLLAIAGSDSSRVTIVEAGPARADGSGALVPYAYPEDTFAARGVVDFEPIVIPPPNGMSEEYFAQLVRATQRAYDGDQRYLVVEIPFLRVGRDSNSYAVGVLLCCGVDLREVPKPKGAMRFEWTGYPGMEDPVHTANFGMYGGAPSRLGGEAVDVALHNEDGSVRYVVVGGAPHGTARLPDGTDVTLDAFGRVVFDDADARSHGLPTTHTEPPQNIRARRRYPADYAAAGAQITIVVDDRCVALEPGSQYSGTIVARHDALGLARMRTQSGEVVLPMTELGVELRDPKRVDRLFRVGIDLTVGLHHDRYPKLVAHGEHWLRDRLKWHTLHAPRPLHIVAGVSATAVGVAALGWWLLRR